MLGCARGLVRYFCYNCDDLPLKTINSVIEHIFNKHSVVVEKDQSFSGFRCEECEVYLNQIIPFLSHMDKIHGIHIWYERGLVRKKVFFDGTLSQSSKDAEPNKNESTDTVRHNVPISKRPYLPRKDSEYSDETY